MPSRTWKPWALASAPSTATPIRSAVPTEPPATRWRSNSDWIALRRARGVGARPNSRLAHPLGAGEGPKVGAAGAVLLAGEVDPREVLVEADTDIGVGLVVAQPDVE